MRSEKNNLLLLTVEKLAKMGISHGSSSTITLDCKQFYIGPAFSLKMRAAAISFCEQEESQGHECLLVENNNVLTVWKQVVNTVPTSSSQSDRNEFIKCCDRELKKCIGPMATFIINELVNGDELLTATQLIDRIVEQIPNPKLAAEFRQKIGQ